MGIEYSLANHKNKTALELGKGSWFALIGINNKGDACLLYKDEIYKVIVEEIWDYLIEDPRENADEWKAYAEEVANKIFNFVGDADPSDITLCNDCDDSYFELRQQKYKWVDSRYSSFDIEYSNRHLKK